MGGALDATIDARRDDRVRSARAPLVHVIVAARDEAALIGGTLAALRGGLPGARLWVAEDGSRDATAAIARAFGATVVGDGRRRGKGQAMSAAASAALAAAGADERRCGQAPVFVLCDADLGGCAGELAALLEPLAAGRADVALARFARRGAGGFGIASAFARRAARKRGAGAVRSPICGQRALSERALRSLLPFAGGYGMELAMTIAAARRGLRMVECELELNHRARGRTPAGFAHRARQLLAFAAVAARAPRTRAGGDGRRPRAAVRRA